jgi:hypothetical protein
LLSLGSAAALADRDGDEHDRAGPYQIGRWGDLPYSDLAAANGLNPDRS